MSKPIILKITNFNDLQKIINKLNNESPYVDGYILDISEYVSFIRPLFIVTIAQFVRLYRSKNYIIHTIKLSSNKNPSNEYLKSLDFERRFHINFENSDTFGCPSSSLPITPVSYEEIPNKKLKIVNFLKNKGLNKDFTFLEVCLDEILNNCFDHAASITGVIAHAQYFDSTNTIKLAICDTGIGVPSSINKYLKLIGKDILSSEDAIKWAFTRNNTTKSNPRNKGLGLNTLLTATNSSKGEFRMITLDKWIINTPTIEFRMRDTEDFFGTAIEIEIRIDNLNEIELEDLSFDDF